MRNLFPGYYRPTKEEFSALWQECIFAFDANVLLNVYRYSQATSERFLEILGQLKERIWLPHQAALEYQENRLKVLSAQYDPYENIPERLRALLDEMRKEYPKHPFIPIQQVLDHINSAIGQIDTLLTEARSGHPDLTENDELREALDDLFADKVGPQYASDELKKIRSEAQERFNKQIPPGYEDDKKGGDKKYGDVVMWYQLKGHAKQLKKPLVLITDDRKADWWQKHKGETIGPRPELINEMKSEAGVKFYMYQAEREFAIAPQIQSLAFARLQLFELGQDARPQLEFRVDAAPFVANLRQVGEKIGLRPGLQLVEVKQQAEDENQGSHRAHSTPKSFKRQDQPDGFGASWRPVAFHQSRNLSSQTRSAAPASSSRASLPSASRFPHRKSRSAQDNADRLFDFWGSFRLPGSAASSAIRITAVS